MFESKAIHHNRNTFSNIKTYFQEKLSNSLDRHHLAKLIFTYDDPAKVEQLTNGIMPKNIKKMSSKNGHYKFFTNMIDLQFSKKSSDEQLIQLMPKMQ